MPSSDDFERAFAESPPPQGGDGRRPSRRFVRTVALVAAAAVVLFGFGVLATGQGGVVEVEDDQVAVIVNYLTGESVVDPQPGYKFFLPFLQQAFLFDKSTQKFFMAGDRDRGPNTVSKLTVRANDGSNFWFEEFEIQYEIRPDMADVILSDSGPGPDFKDNWVRAFARSVLRDEFGRFSASQVADQSNYTVASLKAKDRLNEFLEPHGITIVQIVTPKPKFDERYEKAIEDRKVANQEVERIKARAEQLQRERERKIAEIDSQKAVEYEELKGTMEKERISAEQDKVRVERSADAYKTRLVGDGEADKAAMLEEARALREKATKEAEGLKAKAEALAQQGEILVRERLAERLADIEFNLVPYTRDAVPDRIELETGGAAAATPLAEDG